MRYHSYGRSETCVALLQRALKGGLSMSSVWPSKLGMSLFRKIPMSLSEFWQDINHLLPFRSSLCRCFKAACHLSKFTPCRALYMLYNVPFPSQYLGEMEEFSGRTVLDADGHVTMPLFSLPGMVLVPAQTLPLQLFQPAVRILDDTGLTFLTTC